MQNKKQHWIMLFRRFGLHYFMALFFILGIKCWYGSAGSEELEWILAPTVRWVQVLSGIPFEKAPQNGYINYSLRFIIAPSCSGVRFMLVAFAVLIFPFLYRMKTAGKGWGWMIGSLIAAYVYTIMTNGLRIVLAIYLPVFLGKSLETAFFWEWLTPEKLHTLIGTIVYFTFLLFLYGGTERLFYRKDSDSAEEREGMDGMDGSAWNQGILIPRICLRYLPPAVCYFAVVLGIPFLRRIYRKDWEGFWSYALLVTVTCASVLLCFGFVGTLCKRCKSERR